MICMILLYIIDLLYCVDFESCLIEILKGSICHLVSWEIRPFVGIDEGMNY